MKINRESNKFSGLQRDDVGEKYSKKTIIKLLEAALPRAGFVGHTITNLFASGVAQKALKGKENEVDCRSKLIFIVSSSTGELFGHLTQPELQFACTHHNQSADRELRIGERLFCRRDAATPRHAEPSTTALEWIH